MLDREVDEEQSMDTCKHNRPPREIINPQFFSTNHSNEMFVSLPKN